ncbi:MAG: YkgJ family cysteine cluster protein [Candidatus Heimdallarchaeota archaeon]|nr:MAG: YkgJ family cysteine cluster protein [Candidatus Heimdallarchaeota archaeon]
MSSDNVCLDCIGKDGNDCCIDVYIILNPEEIHLFKKHKEGFIEVKDGGLFYTTKGCPYFEENHCQIQLKKPLYCKYYPVFITGKPFIHDECSINSNYKLTASLRKEVVELQQIYPIYKRDWYWEEVKRELQLQ